MNTENKNEENSLESLNEMLMAIFYPEKFSELKKKEEIKKQLEGARAAQSTVNVYKRPDDNQLSPGLAQQVNERRITDQKDQKAPTRYKVVFKDRNSSPIIISEGLHIKLGEAVGKSNISNFRDTLVHVAHEGEYLTINTSDILNIQKV